MTLALYGKSQPRRLVLVTIALVSVLLAIALGLAGKGRLEFARAVPETLFEDSFGTTATTTVPAPWVDGDGSGGNARVVATFNNAPSTHAVRLTSNAHVHTGIDSTGYTDIIISFWCVGEPANDGPDDLLVEYSPDGGSTWALGDLVNTDTTTGPDCREDLWQFITVDLSAITEIEDNADFRLRLSSSGHGSGEYVYIDDVVVTGEPAAPPPPTTGTIRIEKDAQPDSPQPFDFARSFGSAFTLEDDGTGDGWFVEFTGVAPGAHTVTEPGEEGWTLTAIDCIDTSGEGSTGEPNTGIASINVSAGETVICTFTNVGSASLTITKSPDGQAYAPDDTITFDIDVVNNGTTESLESYVQDFLPVNAIDWETATAGCSVSGTQGNAQTLNCTVPPLDPNGAETFTATVTGLVPTDDPNICGQYTNNGDLYIGPNSPAGGTFDQRDPAPFEIAGCVTNGTIAGHKQNDLDADGAFDGGEPFLANWTIELYSGSVAPANLVGTTTTDIDGFYEFTGVAPGTYVICEVLQAGWVNTAPVCQGPFELTSGETEIHNFFNFQPQDLVVTKDFEASHDLRYAWTIDKSVNPTSVNLFQGDTQNVDYTIAITKDAGTPENVQVSGTITIQNPNPVAITATSVTDSMGGANAQVTCNTLVVPANSSIQCSYSFAGLTSIAGGTSTATAAASYEGVDVSDSGTANVVFGAPVNTFLNSLQVTDSLQGNLGTYSSSENIQYQRTVDCSGVTHTNGTGTKQVPNTATIVDTQQSDDANVTVNCTQRGTIIVDKVTLPAGETRSFSFDLAGGPENVDTGGSLTDAGTPLEFSDLAPGTYTLEELLSDNDPDFKLTNLACDDANSTEDIPEKTASVVLEPGETVTCTFTNTKYAEISFTKTAIGGDDTFYFLFHRAPIADLTFSVTTSGGTGGESFIKLLPGTYGFSEDTNNPNAPEGWDLTDSFCDGDRNLASFTVVAGDRISCTFENTKRGSLRVTKTVSWGDTVNPPATNPSFTICITGASYPAPTLGNGGCQQTTGGDVTWNDLLPGNYVVSETNPGSAWTVQVTDSPATVSPGQEATAGVSNTYNPGGLKATKVVDLQGADPSVVTPDVPPVVGFSFCLSGPGILEDCKIVQVDLSDTPPTAMAVWENLYEGNYTVSETDIAGIWEVNPGELSLNATVVAGQQTDAGTFTNTLKRGALTVNKVWDWNGVPEDFRPATSFRICITGPSAGAGANTINECQTVTGPADTSATFEDLIPGIYTVTELQSPVNQPADDLLAWEVTMSGDFEVGAGQTTDVDPATVTNEYQLGALDITKVVSWSGNTPDEGQAFQICIHLLEGDAPAEGHDPICQTADFDGAVLSFTGLIPGSYRVTEDPLPGDEWAVTGNNVTVIAPAGDKGTSTVTNTLLVGDLNVAKTFDWNGAPADLDQEVEVCIQGPTYPNGDEDGACQTLTPSNTVAMWGDLEVGDYTVTEAFPQGDANEWTTTVDGVAGTTGSGTVSGEGAELVEIANTLKRARIIVHKIYDVDEQDPDESWRPQILVNGQLVSPDGTSITEWQAVEVPANTDIDVQEILPEGWSFVSFDAGQCAATPTPESTVDQLIEAALTLIGLSFPEVIDSRTETVNLAPGTDCHVTFTNEPYGTVTVVKVDNSNNGNEWHFNLSGTAAIEGDADTDHDFAFTGSDEETFIVPLGSYDANETTEGILGSIEECPVLSNEAGEGIYMVKSPGGPQVINEPGAEVTFTITNNDCPVVLAAGSLRLFKWHDLDGDGAWDGNEPGIPNWPITVTGPEHPGGITIQTDANGEYNGFLGILAGFYTVSEGGRPSFYQTGLIVDGIEQPVSGTVVVEVKDHAVGNEIDPEIVTEVAFGNRQLGSLRVVKNVVDQAGNTGRGGWAFNLTGGCKGVATQGVTNASGQLVFENLEPTDLCGVPYLVREVAANAGGFTTQPFSGIALVEIEPGEEATVTFTNTLGSSIVEPTPTPTNTPVPSATPTNTPAPTETPTNTPVPTETVAGEITPGPGSESTPIPPDTGSGFGRSGSGNSWLLLLGIVAITAGAGFISLARRR